MSGISAVTDNRTILQKADLALADLTTSGGLLQPAQALKFMQLLIKQSKLMGMATVPPMRAPKQLIEKIRFGSRVLRAGQEATALASGDRMKPDLSKVELDAKLFKAEVRLDNEVLEDSIEQAQLRETVMQILGEAIARDMEEVAVQGDTTSADTFLAQFNGLLAQATSHTVDVGTVTIHQGVFRDMLKALPSEYLANKGEMKFITSVDAELDWRDALASRATMSGDKYLEQAAPVMYHGIEVIDSQLFPENQGGGTNCTSMLLLHPKNMHFGIWRQIRIETDKLVSEGVLLVVATLRFDVKYANEDGVVKAYNIKVGA